MRAWSLVLVALLAAGLLAGCASKSEPDADGDGFADAAEQAAGSDPNNASSVPRVASAANGPGDAVVIAVVDSGFNPYHFDFRASLMPQALDGDASNDLPLDRDPATWLPGHPGAAAFASYGQLDLTLSNDPEALTGELHTQDNAAWSKVQQSSLESVHMRWIPGTKVIGAVTFNGGDGFASGSHGVGTSSVSTGNLHGTCPSCLLVFVDGTQEQANRWVESQDWIDLQTNSWGFSTSVAGRERVYAHSDTDSQRAAVDRGQSIFFSSGNGVEGAFVATNPTLFSSQEGPDWITTVGAINPDGSSPGSGKPADVAAPGSDYTSAYGSTTVNGTGLFGGTSNATPVTAGLFGEALHQLRTRMEGASRIQKAGVIAQGALACGEANPACATADGQLTVHELREALFRSPATNEAGWDIGGLTGPIPATNGPEATFLAEGHGFYWGRMHGDQEYGGEVQRIIDFAAGGWYAEQDPDQADWFVADSLCRQGGWGAWEHGYAQMGRAKPAPSNDWPARTWLAEVCPTFLNAAVTAEKLLPNTNNLPL
ncbi:MAG: S8 family serine peptidase [Candidatus Thermoplasmatota archaeon]